VVTSDNPRHEVPAAILAAITAGMAATPAAQVIEDRRAAIAWAVAHAGPRDVVLIAGKGHETDQEIAGVKLPFSDVDEALGALRVRAAAGVCA
jgi:UDP-N-acetylmuramoyl-L-alanyl-D-glutamate--2,6-diaminopimelate ligase